MRTPGGLSCHPLADTSTYPGLDCRELDDDRVVREDSAFTSRGGGMDWIIGDGANQRPADFARAIEYVRAGAAPGQHQLVVRRADTAEYLNLFLTWERAMLFWVRLQGGLPHMLIARQPRPP